MGLAKAINKASALARKTVLGKYSPNNKTTTELNRVCSPNMAKSRPARAGNQDRRMGSIRGVKNIPYTTRARLFPIKMVPKNSSEFRTKRPRIKAEGTACFWRNSKRNRLAFKKADSMPEKKAEAIKANKTPITARI